MAHVVIEMDRGNGWEVRQEGAADVTAEALVKMLPAYCSAYSHRAFIDGGLVATARRSPRGKVIVLAA
jgi:hypothetical protein